MQDKICVLQNRPRVQPVLLFLPLLWSKPLSCLTRLMAMGSQKASLHGDPRNRAWRLKPKWVHATPLLRFLQGFSRWRVPLGNRLILSMAVSVWCCVKRLTDLLSKPLWCSLTMPAAPRSAGNLDTLPHILLCFAPSPNLTPRPSLFTWIKIASLPIFFYPCCFFFLSFINRLSFLEQF